MGLIEIPLGKEAGVPYGYIEYKPAAAEILAIHIPGHGERGNGSTADLQKLYRNGFPRAAKEGRYTRTEAIWLSIQYGGKDPLNLARVAYHSTLYKYIRLMIDKYKTAAKVRLMGLSGGAITIWEFLENLKENNALWLKDHPGDEPLEVVAAVMIAGTGSLSQVAEMLQTRLWVFHGENDTKVTPLRSRALVLAYNALHPPVPAVYTEYPFETHSAYVWETTYAQKEVYDWLLKP